VLCSAVPAGSTSRPSGEWSDDDYHVLERAPTHGYAATCEAVRAFQPRPPLPLSPHDARPPAYSSDRLHCAVLSHQSHDPALRRHHSAPEAGVQKKVVMAVRAGGMCERPKNIKKSVSV
jgi:hypothetical protein